MVYHSNYLMKIPWTMLLLWMHRRCQARHGAPEPGASLAGVSDWLWQEASVNNAWDLLKSSLVEADTTKELTKQLFEIWVVVKIMVPLWVP